MPNNSGSDISLENKPLKNPLSGKGRIFLQGIGPSGVIFALFIIMPRLFNLMFVLGLEGASLYIMIAIVPLSLILPILLRLSLLQRQKCAMILLWITGSLSLFMGMLTAFGLDDKSPPSLLILGLLLLGIYLCGIFEVVELRSLAENQQEQKENSNSLIFRFIGMSLSCGICAVLQWFLPTEANLFYLVGFLMIISPIIKWIEAPQLENFSEPWINTPENRFQKSIPARIRIFTLTLFLGVIIALGIYTMFMIPVIANSQTIGEGEILSKKIYQNLTGCWIGLALGFIGWVLISRIKSTLKIKDYLSAIIGIGGLIGCYIWFAEYSTTLNGSPYNLFFAGCIGFIMGILIPEIVQAWRKLSVQFPFQLVVCLLWWAILMAGSSILASQLRWLIRDRQDLLPMGYYIMVALCVVVILILFITEKLDLQNNTMKKMLQKSELKLLKAESKSLQKEDSQKKHPDLIKVRKKILVGSLIFLVAVPSFLLGLVSQSRLEVTIDLPYTMYLVDGTPVTRVVLPARSAVILLNSPKINATAGNEYIRLGRSIRLGAYFYGTENLTTNESVEWIAQNMDVYSLGGWCRWFFNVTEIDYVRSVNPASRFYPMVFATTYWEDPKNDIMATGGNLTVPWSWGVKWNETMHGWTLKLKNGSEAYGVRHGPNTPYDHLMDLGNPGWADYFAWFFQQRVDEFHANGLAIDEVMWNGYWGTDEKDLRDYSSVDQIRATCYEWLKRVQANSTMELMTQAFWPEAQQYQNACWGELAFRCGGAYGGRVDDRYQSIFYESMNWEGVVENMKTLALANKSYIWAAWYNRDDPKALEYAIATYLMGKPNNCTWLTFHPQPTYNGGYPANLAGYYLGTVRKEVQDHPEFFDLQLGNAKGDMKIVKGKGGSVWQRDFENGIILVNPFHARLPGFDSTQEIWARSH